MALKCVQALITSDFDSEVFGHHAVPGSQVSVDKLVCVEVRHAIGNFASHLNHLLQWWEGLAARSLLHSQRKECIIHLHIVVNDCNSFSFSFSARMPLFLHHIGRHYDAFITEKDKNREYVRERKGEWSVFESWPNIFDNLVGGLHLDKKKKNHIPVVVPVSSAESADSFSNHPVSSTP